MFESLPNYLKISVNNDDRKLFMLYLGENEKQPLYVFVESLEGKMDKNPQF